MVIVCDTSLLFSLYGSDAHSPKAVAWAAQNTLPITRHSTVESLLSAVDILSLHTKLEAKSHHLINAQSLKLMKQGSLIINTSRGELVDSAAILGALDSGHLAGYATDVMEQEPPPADHPLLSHPKTLVTAHIGSRTYESVPRQAMKATRNLINCLRGSGPYEQAN
jgi:D-3-phosphoglycerate dehydrogenase / 2-oxoglutarate reductase